MKFADFDTLWIALHYVSAMNDDRDGIFISCCYLIFAIIFDILYYFTEPLVRVEVEIKKLVPTCPKRVF
jgi:hypothetical protein